MAAGARPIEIDAHGEARIWIHAAVLDVGLAGLAIQSETRLPPELPVTVQFGAGQATIALDGRVVWSFFHGTEAALTGEQRPVYRAGVEFSDVLTPAAARLVGFLEQQTASGDETRMFGRFRPATDEPIRVHVTTGFRCLDVEPAAVAAEVRLAFDPPPGIAVDLLPRGAGHFVSTRLLTATRGDAPETWRLELDAGGADPRGLAHLRAVVYN